MPASKQPKITKQCRHCNKTFLSNNVRQLACSKRCNTYYARNLNPDKFRKESAQRMRNRSPEQKRNQKLRETYGISLNIYNQMLSDQNGKCAICGDMSRLFMDHNHATGTVRDLLCLGCNSGIGFFYENISLLDKAKSYLEKWKNK